MIDPVTKKNYACPLNGKSCIDGIRDDFPVDPSTKRKITCRWWQHLFGKDPQTEKQIDTFDCAIAWLPTVVIECAQMSRQTTASVDKTANEVAAVKSNINALARAVGAAATEIRSGIESGGVTVLLPPGSKNGGDPSVKPTDLTT